MNKQGRSRCGLVVLGDSVSEGVGDPGAGGLEGWVHHLTTGSAELALVANLARTGATVSRLRHHQLDRALALTPELVSCVIGVNDVFSRSFDPRAFARDYTHVLDALTGTATTGVLAMTLHDVTAGLPVLTRARRAELRRRTAAANEVIVRTAERHGAWLVDARAAVPMDRQGMLCVDRLHPNRRGHRYIAAVARDLLATHGVVTGVPASAPSGVLPGRDPWRDRVTAEGRHLVWLGRHLAASRGARAYRRLIPGPTRSAPPARPNGGPWADRSRRP